MTALRSAMLFALALALAGATGRNAGAIGFVDLTRAVADHPLHAMLAQYDREIAALQGTLREPGLSDLPAQADNAAAAIARTGAAAQAHARDVAAASAANDRRESVSLGDVFGAPQRTEMGAYATELARETNGTIAAYERSISQRTSRALAARAQQLLEKELTLAFDLARANAGKWLALRLKLTHLHLDREDRARYTAELLALNRAESRAVAAMRGSDHAILARYAQQLRQDGARQSAAMAEQLRAKAAANLAMRRRALQVNPAQAAAFRSSYRASADASDVAGGMSAASADIARRFNTVAQSDRQSQRGVADQLRTLQANRDALYRAIVAQIVREAKTIAASRHLASVTVAATRPSGSVDLTPSVRQRLSGL